MKVAIYARYSSVNQSEKSIDDQIRVCKKHISENGYSFDPEHVYVDEAISGSIVQRPGLQALERAMENGDFQAVAVDDLSRLSRSNHQMLTLVNTFTFHQVKIFSVSDGIVTDEDNSKLGIHIRGLINELYLDDLKKKTMRGLEGQKLRGYSTGVNVYGYKSVPVGELKMQKGKPKYEGMIHKINEEEADIIKRIFKEFISGKSIHKIVTILNEEKTPTKKGKLGGWNTSTVSRILKNEKYVGQWNWRIWKSVRDPITGRKKVLKRPKHEQISIERKDLAIIDDETWKKAQERAAQISGSFPVKKSSGIKQKSYVHSNPNHLLAGLMKCQSCDGAMVLVSGKGSGYYGCYNAKRKTCKNKLLISRNKVEKIILQELKEKLLIAENIQYVFKKIEEILAKGSGEIPEQIKKKKVQYEKVLSEIQNYLSFIKVGNFSSAVSTALSEAEQKGQMVKDEIESLEHQTGKPFKSPPKEWIEHHLEHLHGNLRKEHSRLSISLKRALRNNLYGRRYR